MIARSDPNSESPAPPKPAFRAAPLMVGAALGVLLSGAAILVWLFTSAEPSLPPLTEQAFEQAQQRWEQSGPPNYDVDVEVSGRQSGNFHVEVRNGKVTACTRNGIAVEQVLAWPTWSVPGQFDTIDRELQLAAAPEKFFQVPVGTTVIQQARFDPQYGYPRQYQRRVLGTQYTIAWTTTFVPRR